MWDAALLLLLLLLSHETYQQKGKSWNKAICSVQQLVTMHRC